jgi:uncharacterized iron-regulated membrane protein
VTNPNFFTTRLQTAWQEPRKLRLRRTIFQIHLWCGIAVGFFTAIVGATGSMLVYRETLDRWLAPHLLATTADRPSISIDRMVQQVPQSNPTWKIKEIDLKPSGTSWLVRLEQEHKPDRLLYINPSTGMLLGERGPRQGLIDWIADLHINLLSGATGRLVNGVLGMFLFILCVSGVIIWWPGRAHIRRSMSIHWRARWRRLNWDLHTVGGFWISVPLALQAFTGLVLCLPVIAFLIALLLGGSPKAIIALLVPPKSVIPVVHTFAPINPMVVEARRQFPNARELQVLFAQEPSGSVAVAAIGPEFKTNGTFGLMFFDRYSGKLLRSTDLRNASFAVRSLFFIRPLHYGSFAGTPSKILWIVGGLTPGLLFWTGFLMWWRARSAPCSKSLARGDGELRGPSG